MKKLPIIILFLALISCQETTTQVATVVDGVVTVNVNDLKDTVTLNLSDLVENIEVVQLDSKIEAYVSPYTPMFFSENYIIATGEQVKLFNKKTGDFITNVGARGKGHGEYKNSAGNIHINEENSSIYLADGMAATCIIEYDLQGKFKKQLPLADKRTMNYLNFMIDNEKNLITVFSFPQNVIIWQQDFEGNYIKKRTTVNIGNGNIGLPSSLVTNNTFNVQVSQLFNKQDTLYKYNSESHRINPIFTVKLNNPGIVKEFTETESMIEYIETSNNFIGTITSFESADELSMKANFDKHVIVNKNDLSGSYMRLENDYLFNVEIEKIVSSDGYFYFPYDAEKLLEIIENATDKDRKNMNPKILEKLDALYENLNEESNITLFIGKMK
ncbi:MAG: DUF4934 domain-containing protein [Rikenellaceae bacterium]